MPSTCPACICLTMAMLGSSGRGQSTILTSHPPTLLLPKLLSLRAFVTDTPGDTAVEKPLSLSKVVTNVLLPTAMWKVIGRFCCRISCVCLVEKQLHFPNNFFFFLRNRGLYFLQIFSGSFLLIFVLELLIGIFISFWN